MGNLAGANLGDMDPTDDALVEEPIDMVSDSASSEQIT